MTYFVDVRIFHTSWLTVRYEHSDDSRRDCFRITDMYHHSRNAAGVDFVTNMTHMIDDVMNSGLFAPMRVQIIHEIEMARRSRNNTVEAGHLLPSDSVNCGLCCGQEGGSHSATERLSAIMGEVRIAELEWAVARAVLGRAEGKL